MSDVTPTEISRIDHGIIIQWSDGSRRSYSAAKLRTACPCATCREKHGGTLKGDEGAANTKPATTKPATTKPATTKPATTKPALLPVLSLAEARPTAIERMRPVGNYAYNIAFSDGHDSGIFTFDYLHSIGEP